MNEERIRFLIKHQVESMIKNNLKIEDSGGIIDGSVEIELYYFDEEEDIKYWIDSTRIHVGNR